MLLIKKWWARALTSFVLGGIITEVGFLLTDGEVKLNSLLPAIGFYFLFSFIYGIYLQRSYKD